MPTRTLRTAGLAAIALACSLLLPAAAGATKPADVRVVDADGSTLAEHTQYTGTTRIRARGRADCFGSGTGGSGAKTTVPRATALGITDDASRWDRDIRPVLVTDAFDFGLGICGFGDAVAPQTGYWYLKVNHVGSQVGGDQARLGKGDRVLWYLISDFNDPTPAELHLSAPARTAEGQLEVRVWEYADDGSRSPAAGAELPHALAPTGADGFALIDPPADPAPGEPVMLVLRAERAGSIPSNEAVTCIGERLSDCAKRPPTKIRGSRKGEVIRGTAGADEIKAGRGRDVVRAGRGDDVIDVRGGGRDVVRCGAGDDLVKASKRDRLRGC